jgi:Ni/Fe-hydrogenase subunit HybB-like protein
MELNSYQQETFNHQRSNIEKFGKRNLAWSIFFLLWIMVGAYALYLQIVKGHAVTGMRDNVVWGLFIVNFIFFIGLSYAGAIIAGLLHLLKVPWGKPIIRLRTVDDRGIRSCRPNIYFIMCWSLRPAASFIYLSKITIAPDLGRIGHPYLFRRKCTFSVHGADKRFRGVQGCKNEHTKMETKII